MDNRTNKEDSRHTEHSTDEKVRKELAQTLHEYALTLNDKASIVARIAAEIEEGEPENLDEFVKQCNENGIFQDILKDLDLIEQ